MLANYKWEDNEQKERDSRNSPKKWDEQRFQAVDQSYKDPMISSMVFPTECSFIFIFYYHFVIGKLNTPDAGG